MSSNITPSLADHDYYAEALEAGFNYLTYGFWHQSYAAAVTEATLQHTYDSPCFVDAGGGCGTILLAFIETKSYARSLAIDLSAGMVHAGRREFGFDESQLVLGSMDQIPLPDSSATLIHSGQVLEHVPDEAVADILREFWRVLRPGGRTFHNLAAVRYGEDPNIYYHPTHINVQPTSYWVERFAEAGFLPDFETHDRFARSPRGPNPEGPNFFQHYADQWTILSYIKPAR